MSIFPKDDNLRLVLEKDQVPWLKEQMKLCRFWIVFFVLLFITSSGYIYWLDHSDIAFNCLNQNDVPENSSLEVMKAQLGHSVRLCDEDDKNALNEENLLFLTGILAIIFLIGAPIGILANGFKWFKYRRYLMDRGGFMQKYQRN